MLDFDFETAKAVVTDKTNPHYTRYHNNDPDVNSAVSRAYLKQFPGEIDLADRTPEALKAGGDNQAGASGVAGPESEVETILKAELGSNFDATINNAVDGLGQFFNSAADFEAAVSRLNLSPAQQVQGIKWLAEIGGRGR